jgi:hypothetical protein
VHFDKCETFLVQQMHYLLKHKIPQFVFKCLNVHEGCCLTEVKQHPSYRTHSATLPLSGPQPTTTKGHYTTCCKSQSYAPEDGQKSCPKHVELILEIIKLLLLHLVGLLYIIYYSQFQIWGHIFLWWCNLTGVAVSVALAKPHYKFSICTNWHFKTGLR